MKKLTFILIVLAILLEGPSSYAQNVPFEAREKLTIALSPKHPQAHEKITASVTNYSTDLNSATITWTFAGKILGSGVGLTQMQFDSLSLGRASTLSVVARTRAGAIIPGTVTIQPEDVHLLWQSNSYVPPFYQGKAQYTNQNTVTAVALADFLVGTTKLDPAKLVYTWKRNGTILGDDSGFGKSTYTFEGPVLLREEKIEVEVSTADKTVVGSDSLSLLPQKPEVIVYEDHPLYGIRYEKALGGTFNLAQNELRLAAVPYFFDGKKKENGLFNYNWKVNGESVKTGSERSALTFRKASDSGNARIEIDVTNKNKAFQFGSFEGTVSLSGVFNL